MLTKILVTIAIIVGVFAFMRFKNQSSHAIRTLTVEANNSSTNTVKLVAFGVLSLTLLSGAVMLFLNWQEQHRLFDIKIINPQSGMTDNYQAYKKDLKGKKFTTISGQQITVSELERLEIKGVDH